MISACNWNCLHYLQASAGYSGIKIMGINHSRWSCGCVDCINWRSIQQDKPKKNKPQKKKYRKSFTDYFEYMESEAWKNRKQNYYKKHPRQCRACGSKNNIHLHHLKYGNFGKELDKDLMPLCEACHNELHKLAGSSRDMHFITNLFIQKKQLQVRWLLTKIKKDVVTINKLDS